MNDWIGKFLGKVRIDSLLARGGMAEVYLGTHTTLHREVAVKILRAQYEDDPDLLARFEREAQVVAKLRHSNIVQVFDFDSIDEHPYIVMEYVAGPSLSQYLGMLNKKKLHLDPSEISKILTSMAHALQYAHESGVIHRDIKPGNIILTSRTKRIVPGDPLPKDFEALLTDFGLVRFLNAARQTTAGQTAGTPAYMSPEQARGETTDARTDIYSLGIVLYEMLAGNVPFDGETTVSILLKHISDPLPPVRSLSFSIQRVLEKALAKTPVERYQTPVKFASAFSAALETKLEVVTDPGTMEMTPVSDPSAIPYTEPDPSPIIVTSLPKPRRKLMPIALGSVALALFGIIYLANSGFAFTAANKTPTAAPTIATSTEPPIIPLSGTLNRTAVLHFRDGDAIMDQAFLEAFAVQAPAAGTQYEVWLAGPDGRLSLGVLLIDANGKGTRTYNATTGENLLAKYDQVEVTIKALDAKAGKTEEVAYSYTLPADGLVYIRQLLVNGPEIPDQTALIQSLATDIELLEQGVSGMQKAFANSDAINAKTNAESVINLISGKQSSDYRDWTGNGQTSDPSTGFGLLHNGSNLGDVQAVFAHADYVANSAGASQNMIDRSAEVKACAQNLAQWIPQLKEQAQRIVTAASLTEMEKPIQEAVALVNKIRNGIDLNGNGEVEPLAGECGFSTTYKSAYAMADMPLLPVNLLGSATSEGTPPAVVTFISPTSTPKRNTGGSGGATAVPPPANNGGGNGNGNGNGGGHHKP